MGEAVLIGLFVSACCITQMLQVQGYGVVLWVVLWKAVNQTLWVGFSGIVYIFVLFVFPGKCLRFCCLIMLLQRLITHKNRHIGYFLFLPVPNICHQFSEP